MPATWLTDLPLPPLPIQTDVLKFSLPTQTNSYRSWPGQGGFSRRSP